MQSDQDNSEFVDVMRGPATNHASHPDRRGSSGTSNDTSMSLETAAYFGNFSQLQMMLSKGTPIDKGDKFGTRTFPEHSLNIPKSFTNILVGNTALYFAAMNGNVEIVGLLLRSGANINLQSNPVKETALHVASRNGHELVVKILLKFGADAKVGNFSGSLPIHLAARNGHIEIIQVRYYM